ncbi:MAG: bifunctional metallophosphatase/5'-nucleotidase [Limnochordaceae bacterium]|nr:bifunctional metallophosphatase/5'-nucleotidase [Limnochordaceae bacterium]
MLRTSVAGPTIRNLFAGLMAMALLASPASMAAAESTPAEQPLRLQILAINDFHGALESRTVSGKPMGGAAVLAAYLHQREQQARQEGGVTLKVHVGDIIGASPPISALLQDEPTLTILDAMGFELGTVGNHEFDEGVEELLRLQRGGCHPLTGCFDGTRMQYLAANVVWADTEKPVFPPYAIRWVQGVPVGFIGVVTTETPTIVTASGVQGLKFLDEVQTINRYARELKEQGVETIVVLMHDGGDGGRQGRITGAIVPMIYGMDDEVDVVLTGHTHRCYQGLVGIKLVTQACANGTAFADIDLTIDRTFKDVVAKKAEIVDTVADAPGITPDPAVDAMVRRYAERVAPRVNQVIATAADRIARQQDEAGESALGNLIADAQRWKVGAQFAFMNPGGVRADLDAGEVTWGELYTIQPFNNYLVTMTLTGSQIERLLEQQWMNQPFPRILQISGLRYTWHADRAAGERVDPGEIFLEDGTPVQPEGRYRVVVNSFLADGGDNFTVLREGADRAVGPIDLDALVEYLRRISQPVTARIEGRIRRQP